MQHTEPSPAIPPPTSDPLGTRRPHDVDGQHPHRATGLSHGIQRPLLQWLTRPLLLACLLGLLLTAVGLAVFAQRNIGEESRLMPLLNGMDALRQQAALDGGIRADAAANALRALALDPLRDPLRIRLIGAQENVLFDSLDDAPTWVKWVVNNAAAWMPTAPTDAWHLALAPTEPTQPLTLRLTANPVSEIREAANNLGVSLLALVILAGLLYGLAQRQLRTAFAPLGRITQRLQALESGHCDAAPLEPTGTLELNRITQSVNHLQGELAQLQSRQLEWINRLQDLQESERRQIAAELHDELGQHLTALQFDAAALMRQASNADAAGGITTSGITTTEITTTGIASAARAIQANSHALLQSLKGLLLQLRPGGLDGAEDQTAALQDSLQRMIADWQLRMPDCHIGLTLSLPAYNLPSRLSLATFRLVQEALTNAARHSQASRIDVQVGLTASGQALCIRVTDNGKGMPPSDEQVPRSLLERTRANGGQLQVSAALPAGFDDRQDASQAPASATGCIIDIRLPLYGQPANTNTHKD